MNFNFYIKIEITMTLFDSEMSNKYTEKSIVRKLVSSYIKIETTNDIDTLHYLGLNNDELLLLVKNTELKKYYEKESIDNCRRAINNKLYCRAKYLFLEKKIQFGYNNFELYGELEISFIKMALKVDDYVLIEKIVMTLSKFTLLLDIFFSFIKENINNKRLVGLFIKYFYDKFISHITYKLDNKQYEEDFNINMELTRQVIDLKKYPKIEIYSGKINIQELLYLTVTNMFPNITEDQKISLKKIYVTWNGLSFSLNCDNNIKEYVILSTNTLFR